MRRGGVEEDESGGWGIGDGGYTGVEGWDFAIVALPEVFALVEGVLGGLRLKYQVSGKCLIGGCLK
jgi:hypothetical protein